MNPRNTQIVFAGRFAPPSHGAALMNERYVDYLSTKHDVTVLRINPKQDLRQMGRLSPRSFAWFLYIVILALFLRAFKKPQVIIFELAPTGFGFFRDALLALILKSRDAHFFFMLHARGIQASADRSRLYRVAYKRLFARAKIVILSKVLRSELKGLACDEQIIIHANGIPDDFSGFNMDTVLAPKKKKNLKVVFISNLIPGKGLEDVIDFADILNKRNRDVEINICGKFSDEDYERHILRRVLSLNLSGKCNFLGPRYGSAKAKILIESDIMLFPTEYKHECFPLVILEAYSAGLPVLTYNTGGIIDMVIPKITGYVSQSNDINELVNAVDIEWERSVIRDHFLNNYTLAQCMQNFHALINVYAQSNEKS